MSLPEQRYIADAVRSDTEFNPSDSADLATAISLLEEKWNRFYPLINWRPLLINRDVQTDTATSEARVAGTLSRFDALYGEVIPVDPAGQFVQPHRSDIDASSGKLYDNPVLIRAHITSATEPDPGMELENFGDNASYEFKVTLLTSQLDAAGIKVHKGSQFEWRGRTCEVKQSGIPARGRWKNTNVPLFVVAYASYNTPGS